PRCSANSPSKRFVLGPVVIQSERSVSTTSRISSSPKSGGEKGRNWLRRAGAGMADIAARLRGGGLRDRIRAARAAEPRGGRGGRGGPGSRRLPRRPGAGGSASLHADALPRCRLGDGER